MDRIERARKFNAAMRQQRSAIDKTLPSLLNRSTILGNGNADTGRIIASSVAESAPMLPAIEWAKDIVTKPGDIVWDPNKLYRYVYTGATKMTHANQLFYPGATGVYYWAIIPNILNDTKVFPGVSGIVVYVAPDDIWYDPSGTTKYRWTGTEYQCPSNYYPGAAGVHQWVKES